MYGFEFMSRSNFEKLNKSPKTLISKSCIGDIILRKFETEEVKVKDSSAA